MREVRADLRTTVKDTTKDLKDRQDSQAKQQKSLSDAIFYSRMENLTYKIKLETDSEHLKQELETLEDKTALDTNKTRSDLNKTVQDLNKTNQDIKNQSKVIKSMSLATQHSLAIVRGEVNTYREEVDSSLKRIRAETDTSLKAIEHSTAIAMAGVDTALEGVRADITKVSDRVTALEKQAEDEIGLLTYTLLDECPAGYVPVDGSGIDEYPKLVSVFREYDLPDMRGDFLRYASTDAELRKHYPDTTAPNGLAAGGGYYMPNVEGYISYYSSVENGRTGTYKNRVWKTYQLHFTGDTETAPVHRRLKLCVKAE